MVLRQDGAMEVRELQRSFIAVIAGHRALDDMGMLAFRGLLEFIYYAQFDTQTSEALSKLRPHITSLCLPWSYTLHVEDFAVVFNGN